MIQDFWKALQIPKWQLTSPFLYFNSWNPYPFTTLLYTSSLKKVPLSGKASMYTVVHYREYLSWGNTMRFLQRYSQLCTNGHSRKWTALLTDAFLNPHFTSKLNSVFTHSRKRTLSRKRMQTLLKMKIGFFFCLCSLVSGHPMYNNWLLAMKFVFNLQ